LVKKMPNNNNNYRISLSFKIKDSDTIVSMLLPDNKGITDALDKVFNTSTSSAETYFPDLIKMKIEKIKKT